MRRAEAGIQVDKFYPPTDWLDNNNKQIDIRKNAENNSIVLLVGVGDNNKYGLFGLIAQVNSGTSYDIYIDDVFFATTTSGQQTDVDFSSLGSEYASIGTATTPEALSLHKIVIKPHINTDYLGGFCFRRTEGVTSNQSIGVLWTHFELDSEIDCSLGMFGAGSSQYNCRILYALTAKGDKINPKGSCSIMFNGCQALRYVAFIDKMSDSATVFYSNSVLKRVRIGEYNNNLAINFCGNALSLEQITCKKISKSGLNSSCFAAIRRLKLLPFKNATVANLSSCLTEGIRLYPTRVDVSNNKLVTKLATSGTSSTNQMRGLRGLKVSNEAPFTGTSPQINVSYTGLDRDALVELFQSLPTVTGGQTLNCVACSGNNLTKVGSPTIDENGVASGFGASSYIRTTTSMSYNNSFEMFVEFTFSNDIESVNQMILCEQNNNMRLWKLGSESFIKMRFYDSAISDFRSLNLTYAVQPNTTYKCKAVFKNSKLELFLYDENNNLLEEKSIDNVKVLINQQIKYGSIATSSAYFLGTINLPTTYIKTDSNYLVKGYLLDTDKATATDKGWGLVLS